MWPRADRLPRPPTHPSRMQTNATLFPIRKSPPPHIGTSENILHKTSAQITRPRAPNQLMTMSWHPPSAAHLTRKVNPLRQNAPHQHPLTELRDAVMPKDAAVNTTARKASVRTWITGMDRWRLRAMLSLPAGQFNYPHGSLLPSLRLPYPPAPILPILPTRYYPHLHCILSNIRHAFRHSSGPRI
jgi:hypothetical protein